MRANTCGLDWGFSIKKSIFGFYFLNKIHLYKLRVRWKRIKIYRSFKALFLKMEVAGQIMIYWAWLENTPKVLKIVCMCVRACVCRPKDNLEELVLSFHHMFLVWSSSWGLIQELLPTELSHQPKNLFTSHFKMMFCSHGHLYPSVNDIIVVVRIDR